VTEAKEEGKKERRERTKKNQRKKE